jgi:hypothetical protein
MNAAYHQKPPLKSGTWNNMQHAIISSSGNLYKTVPEDKRKILAVAPTSQEDFVPLPTSKQSLHITHNHSHLRKPDTPCMQPELDYCTQQKWDSP